MSLQQNRSKKGRGRETGPISRKGAYTIAETEARKAWVKDNTTFIGIRLNHNTDKDILTALDGKQKQTEIKRLIRKALEKEEK